MSCIVCQHWSPDSRYRWESGTGDCRLMPTPVQTKPGYRCSHCYVDPQAAKYWFQRSDFERDEMQRMKDQIATLKRKLQWHRDRAKKKSV